MTLPVMPAPRPGAGQQRPAGTWQGQERHRPHMRVRVESLLGEISPVWVSEGGLEHACPWKPPDPALDHADRGKIPCSGISCTHVSERASPAVKHLRHL